MTARAEEKRFLLGVPLDVEWDMLRSAKAVIGKDYTMDYYASIASEFTWLYAAGVKAGKAAARKVKRQEAK